MKNKAKIERIINLMRPRAKFVDITHAKEFMKIDAHQYNDYYYTNLYDEQIDSNVLKTPYGLVLVHNTYLSSFAYNLFLSWIFDSYSKGGIDNLEKHKKVLLKYNLKKFFGEQLYAFHNNIFSRAILLETLLYEQQLIIPIFELKQQNTELDKKANFAASVMSQLVSLHELGHYYLDGFEETWEQVLGNSKEAQNLFQEIEQQYPDAFLEEVRCDIIAVLNCINQHQSTPKEILLPIIVFAYATYAAMYGLTKSAKATSIEHKKEKDEVDFLSIKVVAQQK